MVHHSEPMIYFDGNIGNLVGSKDFVLPGTLYVLRNAGCPQLPLTYVELHLGLICTEGHKAMI